MQIDKKNQKVTVTYKDNKISIFNEDRSVAGVLEISGTNLKNMYWGKKGYGTLHLQVIEEEDDES